MPGGQYHFNSRGNYEDDIDNEPLYDPVAPRIDYEVHDFDANPRDEANRRLAYRRDNARQQQDVIYDGPADDLPMYHGSKVRKFAHPSICTSVFVIEPFFILAR